MTKKRTKIIAAFMAVLMMCTAFICPQLFQNKETSTAEAATFPNSATWVKVTGSSVNVRSAPNTTSGNVIYTASAGDIFTYEGYTSNSYGNWYEVIYRTNNSDISYVAYISASYATTETQLLKGIKTCNTTCKIYTSDSLGNTYRVQTITSGTQVGYYLTRDGKYIVGVYTSAGSLTGYLYGYVNPNYFS